MRGLGTLAGAVIFGILLWVTLGPSESPGVRDERPGPEPLRSPEGPGALMGRGSTSPEPKAPESQLDPGLAPLDLDTPAATAHPAGTILVEDEQGVKLKGGRYTVMGPLQAGSNQARSGFQVVEFMVNGKIRAGIGTVDLRNVSGPSDVLVVPVGGRLLSRTLRGVDLHAGPLRVVLRAGVLLQGTVVHTDGRPAEGVHISARAAHGESRRTWGEFANATSASGPDGAFEVRVAPDKASVVTAVSPRIDHPKVDVDAPRGARSVRLVLPEEATLEVLVLRPGGGPAQEVRVRIERAEDLSDVWVGVQRVPRPPSITAKTDAGGVAILQHLPPEAQLVVSALTPTADDPFPAIRHHPVNPQAGRITLRLQRGLSIRGHLVDTSGAPITHARIVATPLKGPIAQRQARILVDGAFEIPALEPGDYRVELDGAPTHGSVVLPRVTAPTVDLHVELPDAFVLEGRLTGADKDGLRAHWVGARQRMRASRHGSKFLFLGLLDEPGDIYVGLPGHRHFAHARVRSPRDHLAALEVKRGACISGRMVGPHTGSGLSLGGQPRQRFAPLVRLVVIGAKLRMELEQFGMDGQFSTMGLPPGIYRLEVRDRQTGDLRQAMDGVQAGATRVQLRWK